MVEKTKRVRLTNSGINAYGTRILTEGMELKQYARNPVLLYMHNRGEVIGLVKDVVVDGEEITAELVFDEASELSKRCKKQFEFGSLRMVSVGIDILELSSDKKHLLQGQTRPTISKSKLVEVSLVDVGANDDAIVLYRGGKQLNLASGADAALLPELLNHKENQSFMNEELKKEVALLLGLPDTASVDELLANVKVVFVTKDAEITRLQGVIGAAELAAVTDLVAAAVTAKKIAPDKKDFFVEMGKKVGREELSKVFDSMHAETKITDVVDFKGGNSATGKAEYKKLSEVPASEMMELRTNNPQKYAELYKAEYGIECPV